MKIIFADQLTPKIESGPSGGIESCQARITVPAAVQPAPASTNRTPFPSSTRTPTEAAASSSSRIACNDVPRRLRKSRNRITSRAAAAASAAQYV